MTTAHKHCRCLSVIGYCVIVFYIPLSWRILTAEFRQYNGKTSVLEDQVAFEVKCEVLTRRNVDSGRRGEAADTVDTCIIQKVRFKNVSLQHRLIF